MLGTKRTLELHPFGLESELPKKRPKTKIGWILAALRNDSTDHRLRRIITGLRLNRLKFPTDEIDIPTRLNEIQNIVIKPHIVQINNRLQIKDSQCSICGTQFDDIGLHFCDMRRCESCSHVYISSHMCPVEQLASFVDNLARIEDQLNFIQTFNSSVLKCTCGNIRTNPNSIHCKYCRPKDMLIPPEGKPCTVCGHVVHVIDDCRFVINGNKVKMDEVPTGSNFEVLCHQCDVSSCKTAETCSVCRRLYKPHLMSQTCNSCVKKIHWETNQANRLELARMSASTRCSICNCKPGKCIEQDHVDIWCKGASIGSLLQQGVDFDRIIEELKLCRPLCVGCHRFVTHVERSSGLIQFKILKLDPNEHKAIIDRVLKIQTSLEEAFIVSKVMCSMLSHFS